MFGLKEVTVAINDCFLYLTSKTSLYDGEYLPETSIPVVDIESVQFESIPVPCFTSSIES